MNQIKFYISNFYKKHQDLVNISILVLLTVIVFYNSLGGYFSEVDDLNSLLHSDRSVGKIFTTNTYGYNDGGNYRPIEYLSHQFDRHLYGDDNSFGRHVTNLLIHIFNIILVYLLASYLTKRKTIGLMSGLLFALHILHGDSLPPVAWISGRVDPFVTFFLLLTLILFIKFLAKRSILIYLISLITFIFALWSKEMAISFPLILVIYIFLFSSIKEKEELTRIDTTLLPALALILGISLIAFAIIFSPRFAASLLSSDGNLLEATINKINSYRLLFLYIGGFFAIIFMILKFSKTAVKLLATIKYTLPYFSLSVIYLFARIQFLGGMGGNYTTKEGSNQVFQLSVESFLRDIYGLAGLFWPVGSEYNITIFRFQIEHNFIFFAFSVILFIILLALFIWLIKHKLFLLTFFYMWIFVNLMPVHNSLIAIGQYQSRYLYLSSVGFSIFISILFYKLIQSKNIPTRLSKAFVIFLMVIILVFNSIFILKNNEKMVASGEIMKNFVVDMKEYQQKISKAANLYFITFPISKVNSMDAVFASFMLEESLNYIDNFKGYGKRYIYSILLYNQGSENKKVNLTWQDDRNFILDEIDYQNNYLIPKNIDAFGQQIEKIYNPKPHARLEPFSFIGETKETKNAYVKVLEVDKKNKRTKLSVKLNDKFIFYPGSNLFFLYGNGRFRLVKEVFVPKIKP